MVRKSSRLKAALNGTVIGTLTKESNGGMTFIYHADWLDTPGARPLSLSLPLTGDKYAGAQVYNFFDNLLPDSDIIRSRLQTRFATETKQPFDLLSRIGIDCVGAIQLYPDDVDPGNIRQIKKRLMSEAEIANRLRDYRTAPLGMENDFQDFRISIAGAQEKTALLKLDNQWYLPLNSTPTNRILKLPIGEIAQSNIDLTESCENEWLCSEISRAFGIPTAYTQIETFEDQKVLSVERFDRRWSKDKSWLMRLPQEDFCQALAVAPAQKYQSDGGPGILECMKLLEGSQDVNDRVLFFKSQILFWLLAATDGHAKNFSLFLEAGAAYRMTPLYDIISVYPLMNKKRGLDPQKIKMAMALIGRNNHYHWSNIHARHFIATAKKTGISEKTAQTIMKQMGEQTQDVIEKMKNKLPQKFPEHIAAAIFSGLGQQADKLLRQLLQLK